LSKPLFCAITSIRPVPGRIDTADAPRSNLFSVAGASVLNAAVATSCWERSMLV